MHLLLEVFTPWQLWLLGGIETVLIAAGIYVGIRTARVG